MSFTCCFVFWCFFFFFFSLGVVFFSPVDFQNKNHPGSPPGVVRDSQTFDPNPLTEPSPPLNSHSTPSSEETRKRLLLRLGSIFPDLHPDW